MQVPTDPATAHELQSAPQAVLQQTPCAQNPELQAALVAHVAPIDSRPQVVPVQLAGARQSVLEVAGVQLVLHALVVLQV
jgi:hypothetical protein